MNPLFERQVQELRAVIEQTADAITKLQGQVSKAKAEVSKIRQENWSRQREAVTAQRAVEEYEELEARCQRYEEKEEEVRKRLQDLLALTRALQEQEDNP